MKAERDKMMGQNTSLLYGNEVSYTSCQEDSLFFDLNIDQIVSAITEGLEEYRFADFYFERPVLCADAEYRMAVARDLWDEEIRETIVSFQISLNKVKRYLHTADSIRAASVKGKWKLDAVLAYIEAIAALLRLADREIASEGLHRVLTWAQAYAGTEAFVNLREISLALQKRMDSISYSLKVDIVNNVIYFGDDTSPEDVCAEFYRTFDRYGLGHINRELVVFADIHRNVVEEKILAILQAEHPVLLAALADFASRCSGFIHEKIAALERETWFFTSYINFAKRLEGKGFPFSFPAFSRQSLRIAGGYDVSLAMVKGNAAQIVKNDFEIREGERSFLLIGPNQGGKTTFARMFGQILYLSSLGLPVPCDEAVILWTNGLQTHFIREENPGGDTGRLKEELLRLKRILSGTADKSVVILNELFSSTTTYDALEMGKHVLKLFEKKGCICLYITHLFELANDGRSVSLIAEVSADCAPAFRIARSPVAGSAFANRLLAKHHLRASDINTYLE